MILLHHLSSQVAWRMVGVSFSNAFGAPKNVKKEINNITMVAIEQPIHKSFQIHDLHNFGDKRRINCKRAVPRARAAAITKKLSDEFNIFEMLSTLKGETPANATHALIAM
ncbi:hypothetical protein RB653_008521 [Dictyostelium firmibasis]|uniref:Uncharacterized protein n=1 Tax=Dictyostelium firmibasis TaxID=79012 RepID=A0AAN7U077_9MYCE